MITCFSVSLLLSLERNKIQLLGLRPGKWSARGGDAPIAAWAHPEDDVQAAEPLLIAPPLTRSFDRLLLLIIYIYMYIYKAQLI